MLQRRRGTKPDQSYIKQEAHGRNDVPIMRFLRRMHTFVLRFMTAFLQGADYNENKLLR